MNSRHEKTITIRKSKKRKGTNSLDEDEFPFGDIDGAEFEEVMIKDKRSFWEIFLSFFSNFHLYLSLCFTKNIYVPWCVRASICLFTIELYFTLTALLMRASQFEERYKSKQDISIIYIIKNEFENIIYASLISKVMNLIKIYIYLQYPIIKVIKDYRYQGNIYLDEIRKALYYQKCKYYTFMIIFIVLTCLQGFYITCFCAVYIGSVKEWIYSTLIAFIFNFVMGCVFITLAAIFRKLSIICENWLLFIISNFFLNFA